MASLLHRWLDSLVVRVYALYSATLLLFVCLGLGLFYLFQFSQHIEEAQDSATMLVEVAALVVADSAVIGDYDTIKRTLDGAILRSQFASAAFIDLGGAIVRSENVKNRIREAPDWLVASVASHLHDVNRVISAGGKDYGILRLSFAAANIADALWEMIRAALLLALSAFVGGVFLISFPLRRWLGTLERVRKFERIEAVPGESPRALIERVPLEFRHLFRVLADTTDELRNELEAREKALVTLHATLKQMVPDVASREQTAPGDLEAVARVIGELVAERESGRRALDHQKFALDQHAIVSITDRAGRIVYANDRFCANSGYAREELIGKTHQLVKSGMHPPEFYATMWATILAGQVWQGEVCNRSRDGRLSWFSSTIVPLPGPDGQPEQFIGIRTDITERKAAEAALAKAKEVAEEASRAKSDFLANMSHEIRTPMNGVIGMTDLALATELTAEQRDYLEIVKSSADSLLTIINDILDFSKIEAGKMQIETIPFDVRQLAEEICRLLHLPADNKNLELSCSIGANVPQVVRGDPTRVRQVLLNLVGNAIKFTNVGEVSLVVSVAPGASGSRLLFAVSDTGVGVSIEKQAHIFEAFAQEDSSITRRHGGTGLGLSICSRLVELMGGGIGLESMPGVGSTFSFWIPLLEAEQRVGLVPDGGATNAPMAGQKRRLLLVEDNRVNQKLATALLERDGFGVALAQNGEEALAIFRQERFAAVLMDMQMPLMDGLEATRRIRQYEETSGQNRTPVIAMTANAMQGDREQCLEAGMDDYLSKPIRSESLRDTLRRWV